MSPEVYNVAEVKKKMIWYKSLCHKDKTEKEKEQVGDREKLIYQPKMKGLQQLLEKQPNYVESLQGMKVTVMRFLSSKDFHWAPFLIFQKSPSEAILDYRTQRVKPGLLFSL